MASELSHAVIPGTFRGYRSLADGTLSVRIDIEPRDVPALHEAFRIDVPVALARLTNEAATQDESERNAVVEKFHRETDANWQPRLFGEAARELRLSGFFRAPAVWAAIGTDVGYQAWCREQKCAACGKEGGEQNPIVYAHVRRIADGAGVGIKPDFSGIPLHDSEHRLQHQKGESAIAPPEQWDKWRIDHVQKWAWESLRALLGYDSMAKVPPKRMLDWAQRMGVENYLPAAYRDA